MPQQHFAKLSVRPLLICDYDLGLLDALSELLDHIQLSKRVLLRKQIRKWQDGVRWQDGRTQVVGLPLRVFRELSYERPSQFAMIMSVMAYLVVATLVGVYLVLRDRLDPVVSIFTFPQGVVAVLIGQITGHKVAILTDGGDIDFFLKRPAIRPIMLWALRRADVVTALNKTKANQLLSIGVPAPICATFGVDTTRFEYVPFEEKEKRSILYVGRLCFEKGLDVLLEACEMLQRRGVCFRLFLIGDGPLKGHIQQAVAQGGMVEAVSLLGYIPHSEVHQFYRKSAIFVLPSIAEGVSVSLLEAMSSGCLCIVSDIPDNMELIQDMQTGTTFRLGDHEDLAERLEWATSEASALTTITRKARNLVERRYSLQAVGETLVTILASLKKET